MIGDSPTERWTPTIAVPTLWALLDAAASRGVTHGSVVEAAALDVRWLDRSDGSLDRRLPLKAMDAAWREVMRRVRDAGFPIVVGRTMKVESYQLFGFLVKTSANMGDAFERVGRYSAVWTEGGTFSLERDGARARIVYRHQHGSDTLGARCATECVFTEIVALCRALTPGGFDGLRVEFAHRAPGDTTAHAEFFSCPVTFGAPRNVLDLDVRFLARPMPARDATMVHYFEQQTEDLLRTLGASTPGTSRSVAESIVALLPGGDASIGRVARALGTSERTLRRRLADEGVRYDDLLQTHRRALAERYLKDVTVSLAEIALLLGFSDQTAFQRAFRRWSGTTPGAFRARLGRL